MSTVSEIADYLEAVTPTLGIVFVNTLPASPDECIALLEYGGAPSSPGFGVEGVQHEYPGVQVLVRGERDDHDTPRDLIERVYRKLATIQATTLGSTKYLMAIPMQAPYPFRTDENGRRVFAVSFRFEKEPSA